MTREQAGEVVATLAAGFPAQVLEPTTVKKWVEKIAELDEADVALAAADRLFTSRTKFPALAEILDEYRVELHRRDLAARTASPDETDEWEPDPELLAEMRGFALALKVRMDSSTRMALPVATPGSCDDCGQVGDRVEAGARQLCEPCALARARAAARETERTGDPAPTPAREAAAA